MASILDSNDGLLLLATMIDPGRFVLFFFLNFGATAHSFPVRAHLKVNEITSTIYYHMYIPKRKTNLSHVELLFE